MSSSTREIQGKLGRVLKATKAPSITNLYPKRLPLVLYIPCNPPSAPHVLYRSFILANSLSSSFQDTGPAIP